MRVYFIAMMCRPLLKGMTLGASTLLHYLSSVHQRNGVHTWWCREAKLFDLASGSLIRSLTDNEGGGAAGSERAQRHHRDVAAFSPGDELLLWGNALWDPRAPRRLHRFDQFTDFSGGVFHPAGAALVYLTSGLQRVL